MTSQVSKKVLASYSMVALPIGSMAMPIAIYMPPLYSGSLGLSLATVGLIFTLARVWDLITDPIMGVVIDRYGSRWGQYKHWVALAIPVVMLAVYKVFLPNPSDVSALYLGGWLLVLYIGYTMLSISHNSWGSVLARDYDERSTLFGWREIFIILRHGPGAGYTCRPRPIGRDQHYRKSGGDGDILPRFISAHCNPDAYGSSR